MRVWRVGAWCTGSVVVVVLVVLVGRDEDEDEDAVKRAAGAGARRARLASPENCMSKSVRWRFPVLADTASGAFLSFLETWMSSRYTAGGADFGVGVS